MLMKVVVVGFVFQSSRCFLRDGDDLTCSLPRYPCLIGSELGRSASFKDQRHAHYDEFHQVRELRRKASYESFNDDDEEKLNGESDTPSSLAVGVEDIDITDVEYVREPPPQKSSSPA